MDENSTANMVEEKLPSVDYALAVMIFVFYLTSMAVIIPVFPHQQFPIQTISPLNVTLALKIENLREDSGETILLASIKPRPSSFYKPSSKPSKNDFKIKESKFKFPPFKGKKGEHIFHPIIDKASEKHNIDPALIKAVIMAESSYNPRAVSPKGAIGLMQLMPNTAESLGVANSYNPEQNVQGGTKYLRKLIDQLDGDIKLALAAYNAGLARVKKHNGIPPFKDTEYYVHKVYHYYDFYKNQEHVQAHQNVKRNKNEIAEDVDEA
jgi:soluble lytic murein transglycosylase-like protein